MTASPYKIKHNERGSDFRVVNHGTIFIFYALTKEAQEDAEIMFADAQTWGDGYVVEHRCASPIIEDLQARGFTL